LKPLAAPLGSRHRLALLAGAVALLALSLLLLAGRASADQVYWVNQESISYSQLDDSGGGFLNSSVYAIRNGEGLAIDTANSRVYVAQEATNQIAWFSLDGNNAGVVATAPGTVDHPVNVSIEPETQTLYWANDASPGSIGFARVDGSGGGTLSVPGIHVQEPSRLAVDTFHHRVYWWNEGSKDFSWAATSGLTGANLQTPGLTPGPGKIGGMVVEPYSTPEELYFVNNELGSIFHTDPELGGAPESVQGTMKGNVSEPTGLAYDSSAVKFYWANRGVDEVPKAAIGTATLFGRPGTLAVYPVAPVHNPVFAAILKQPEATGAPEIALSEYTLSCTLGHWEGDQPGASVYAAPTTYRYEWRRGSTVIEGANQATLTATETGSYSCAVVAVNQAGETAQKSRSVTVTLPEPPKDTTTTTTTKTTTTSSSSPSSSSKSTAKPATPTKATAEVTAKLASTKPTKAKAGGTAVIKVTLANAGGATAGSSKVCGTLTKQAKKGLATPACVTVKSVAAGATAVAGLSVKTLAAAKGTYKLTVAVSGAATGSMTAKVQVAGAKRK
jgi:hypothetical protein